MWTISVGMAAYFGSQATLKYEAWEKVKDLSVEDAQEQYIKLVAELGEKYGFKE